MIDVSGGGRYGAQDRRGDAAAAGLGGNRPSSERKIQTVIELAYGRCVEPDTVDIERRPDQPRFGHIFDRIANGVGRVREAAVARQPLRIAPARKEISRGGVVDTMGHWGYLAGYNGVLASQWVAVAVVECEHRFRSEGATPDVQARAMQTYWSRFFDREA